MCLCEAHGFPAFNWPWYVSRHHAVQKYLHIAPVYRTCIVLRASPSVVRTRLGYDQAACRGGAAGSEDGRQQGQCSVTDCVLHCLACVVLGVVCYAGGQCISWIVIDHNHSRRVSCSKDLQRISCFWRLRLLLPRLIYSCTLHVASVCANDQLSWYCSSSTCNS